VICGGGDPVIEVVDFSQVYRERSPGYKKKKKKNNGREVQESKEGGGGGGGGVGGDRQGHTDKKKENLGLSFKK